MRAINATMEDMGTLHLGLPSPVAVPFQYNVIAIDLQDCFFTIPLADQDCKQFAFSLPSANLKKTLESPLDCKEIQPVHSEGDQPWDFFGRNDAKAETPVLWPPHGKG